MPKVEVQTIRPFSNGTEAMIWYEENCDRCVKAYKGMPDYNTTVKLVNLGMECKYKFGMDMAHITGEVELSIAEAIGYVEGKHFPRTCLHFSDDDNDRWKRPPTKRPKGDNDLQMCLPYAINDIVMNEELVTA